MYNLFDVLSTLWNHADTELTMFVKVSFICTYIILSNISNSIASETVMFTKVFKIILSHAVLVTLVMFSKDICRFSLKNMSMSLIKIYRTPTTTNERLPNEQQNGYHGFATEQFIEGEDVTTALGRTNQTSPATLQSWQCYC